MDSLKIQIVNIGSSELIDFIEGDREGMNSAFSTNDQKELAEKWVGYKIDKRKLDYEILLNDQRIGMFSIVEYLEKPFMRYFCHFYLKPFYRGKGIGRLVLNWVQEKLCFKELFLVVHETNKQAYQLYKNCGLAFVDQSDDGRIRLKFRPPSLAVRFLPFLHR